MIPQRMKIEATSNGIVPLLGSTGVGMLAVPMNAALIPVNCSGNQNRRAFKPTIA